MNTASLGRLAIPKSSFLDMWLSIFALLSQVRAVVPDLSSNQKNNHLYSLCMSLTFPFILAGAGSTEL